MALYQKYNSENVLIRSVIAGLLDVLNNHIQYEQVWGNDDVETVSVEWDYNYSGDERFQQDFFTHYAECLPPRPVDGNFPKFPRGSITYTGSTINAQRITSRYVQGRYVKEVDGKLESYVSFLYSIPLNIRFDCEMWIDRQITALKIEQEIRETFYKTLTYYVYYKGLRIGCTVGFPEDITIEKNINYSFESDNKIKITFQLEVESYQPVFDKTTEMLSTTNIRRFAYRLYDKGEKNDGEIRITSPQQGSIIPKGIPLWVEWLYSKEGAVINKVDFYWSETNTNERNEIDLMQPNHEYYIWNIPVNFTNYKEPDIIWEENSNISVSRKPIIKIIPNLSSKLITSSSFRVFNEGYFLASIDASINIQLEMKDDNGLVSYTPDGAIWANVTFNKLDASTAFTVDSSIIFPGTIDYKDINIYVSNSVNQDVFGIVHNIKIV